MLPNRRMLQRWIALSVLLLSHFIFYVETMKTESFHAIKTARYPRRSCLQIVNTPSKRVCFIRCLNKLDVLYMFSYNKILQSCMCCQDLSGNDITDNNWETYELRKLCEIVNCYSLYHGDLEKK